MTDCKIADFLAGEEKRRIIMCNVEKTLARLYYQRQLLEDELERMDALIGRHEDALVEFKIN